MGQKATNEMKRLNEENQSLLEQRNQISDHYKEECSRLWQVIQKLDQDKQGLSQEISNLHATFYQ